MLGHDDAQTVRPRALNRDCIHPRDGGNRMAHCAEINAYEARVANLEFHGALDVCRRDALEAARHGHGLDGLVERPQHHADSRGEARKARKRDTPATPVDLRALEREATEERAASLVLSASIFRFAEHRFLTPSFA